MPTKARYSSIAVDAVHNIKNVTNLILQPTKKHLSDIEKWLKEEKDETNLGFHCNWDIISESFEKGNLNVIVENDTAIGFVVYRIYDLTAVIDIAEIQPIHRKNGFAKMLMDETLKSLKLKGVLAIELFCSPEDSEPFWKKIGFKNFPPLPRNSQINLYKTLIETLPNSEKKQIGYQIKLWDCEPHQALKRKPKWIWNLSFINGNTTLTNPIIFPVAQDWQIELSKNEKVIISKKVKYCGMDDVDYGNLMIIRNING